MILQKICTFTTFLLEATVGLLKPGKTTIVCLSVKHNIIAENNDAVTSLLAIYFGPMGQFQAFHDI
jgi:hypothetical protein